MGSGLGGLGRGKARMWLGRRALCCRDTTDVGTFGYPQGDLGVWSEYSRPPIYAETNSCIWLLRRRRNHTLHNWNEIELVENKCTYLFIRTHLSQWDK